MGTMNTTARFPGVDPRAPRPTPGPSGREFLVVEGKYFLTDEGVNYCTQKRIPVRDLRPYRSAPVSGFTWSSVNAPLLERFVTHGLLAGIELERTEFVSQRDPILRLIEVVLGGVVLRRFSPVLQARLRDHEAYRQLVTQGVPPARLRAALQQHADAWARVRSEVRESVDSRVGSTKTAQLVDLVDDTVWFLLVRGQGTTGGQALARAVVDAVVAYAGRLELSGMIALNLMEFLQQAEKAHFLNLAERDQFARKSPEAIPQLLANATFRERLIERAKRQNEMLVMNMSFEGSPRGPGGLVVKITVRNKGVAGNSRRHESLTSRGEGRVLSEDDLGSVDGDLAKEDLSDLAFMNLAALTLLCRDQGIALDVGLTRDERADETVATMTLVF